MKKTILSILFLLPLLATAQEVTFDTTYLSQVNGEYFVIQRVEYENGEYKEESRVIGDSIATIGFLTNSAINEQQSLTTAAVKVIKRGQVTERYNLLGMLYRNLTGQIFYREMNKLLYPNYQGNWRIKYNGEVKSVATELLGSGNARFVDDQNAVWLFRIKSVRNFTIQNWDGLNWDMWSEDGIVFYDLNRDLIIKKTQ